jgi:hypothetical protein
LLLVGCSLLEQDTTTTTKTTLEKQQLVRRSPFLVMTDKRKSSVWTEGGEDFGRLVLSCVSSGAGVSFKRQWLFKTDVATADGINQATPNHKNSQTPSEKTIRTTNKQLLYCFRLPYLYI